jgi:hypothetical protein
MASLVRMAAAVWCEMEKLIPLGRGQETIQLAVDCFAMERSSSGPLGKDLHADGSRIRDSRGCSLACSRRGLQWMTSRLKVTHQRSLGF